MPHFEIISLFVLVLIAWLWFDNLKAREIGIDAVRKACEEEGLQLLDETIGLVSMKPAKDAQGRLVWLRVYLFEYSDTGDNRRRGGVHMLGHKLALLNVGMRLVASNGRLTSEMSD